MPIPKFRHQSNTIQNPPETDATKTIYSVPPKGPHPQPQTDKCSNIRILFRRKAAHSTLEEVPGTTSKTMSTALSRQTHCMNSSDAILRHTQTHTATGNLQGKSHSAAEAMSRFRQCFTMYS